MLNFTQMLCIATLPTTCYVAEKPNSESFMALPTVTHKIAEQFNVTG